MLSCEARDDRLDEAYETGLMNEYERIVRVAKIQYLLLIGSIVCFLSGIGICLVMLKINHSSSWNAPLHALSEGIAGISSLLLILLGLRILLHGLYLRWETGWLPFLSAQEMRERRIQISLTICLAFCLLLSLICW